ncbi:hypothetical protein GOP47_0019393 [Adiantum capillus-veneris]|uniref:ATP-dependent RNA helicase n=1 Tax=Adiantum capillus-veneris TaxID=13818 RepID=A0A9D4UBY3_ADICA|nr:hypothetical protein GOP47_0019393 [Adiantum capillus-veneris]
MEKRDGKRKFQRGRKDGRMAEAEEIAQLEARLSAGAPAPGSNPLAHSLPLQNQQPSDGAALAPFVGAKLFQQLPLSERTKRGLTEAKFTHMTAIQRAALPHGLCGRDVLGAAKTGSGKTLAFLIPAVEKLFRMQWGAMDGVGALIISPTRELAVQIFEELRKVGKHHSLSGGLLIGGRKDVDSEKGRVNKLNILVCTPGRLLQHMDETPNFDCSQLQVLVLDEADRILDMGFANTLNAIVTQLPKQRQTLLFSATQTKSVKDLARLSLKDPEYLAVHAESAVATPARLQQTAMIVPLNEKMDTLWSFIKTHLQSKTLVFLSSCKQVKFVLESFKRLRPGVPLKCLHGRMKQTQRMVVFFKFCEEKHSVLFATDIAARGLDFPAVDWVVQVDCPEDVPSYIHRVGRTARYTSGGRSVIFLSPSEAKMIEELQAAKIPIKVIKPNRDKIQAVSGPLAGLLSKDPDLKYMAQRAFITYIRSIHIRGDKEIFDVTKLPLDEYSLSLGLPTTPRIRFLKKGMGTVSENVKLKHDDDAHTENDKDSDQSPFGTDEKVSVDLHGEKLLTKKRPVKEENEQEPKVEDSLGTRINKKKKLKINPNRPAGKRFVFDDEGNALPPLAAFSKGSSDEELLTKDPGVSLKEAAQERYQRLKLEMQKRDKEDKLLEKRRLQDKRNKKKQRSRPSENENGLNAEEDDLSNERLQSGLPAQKKYFADDSFDESDLEVEDREAKTNVHVHSLSLSAQESLALRMLNFKS